MMTREASQLPGLVRNWKEAKIRKSQGRKMPQKFKIASVTFITFTIIITTIIINATVIIWPWCYKWCSAVSFWDSTLYSGSHSCCRLTGTSQWRSDDLLLASTATCTHRHAPFPSFPAPPSFQPHKQQSVAGRKERGETPSAPSHPYPGGAWSHAHREGMRLLLPLQWCEINEVGAGAVWEHPGNPQGTVTLQT